MKYRVAYNTYHLKSCNVIHSVADVKGERYAARFKFGAFAYLRIYSVILFIRYSALNWCKRDSILEKVIQTKLESDFKKRITPNPFLFDGF